MIEAVWSSFTELRKAAHEQTEIQKYEFEDRKRLRKSQNDALKIQEVGRKMNRLIKLKVMGIISEDELNSRLRKFVDI